MKRGWKFWSHVDKSGECWLWTGRIDHDGYGQTRWGQNHWSGAHRVAWMLTKGPIPNETLDHLCRNRQCVNPAHLEPVSNAENIRRGLYGALRTHCKRGHELTESNLVKYAPPGAKWCLTCTRAGQRRRQAA